MLPSRFLALDRYEKAFVMAAIDLKLERDAEAARK